MITYLSNQFRYNSPKKTFGAQRSTLGLTDPTHGIELKSTKTGAVVSYQLAQTKLNKQQTEILGWVFTPIAPSAAAVGTRILVDNA